MNVNHRLRVGSVSKSISSVAIFRLIEAGATYGNGKKLTLNSPIMGPDGILPDLKAPPQLPEFASAQVHHILEHMAGLPGQLTNEEVSDPTNCSAGNLVQRINYAIAQVKPIPALPPRAPRTEARSRARREPSSTIPTSTSASRRRLSSASSRRPTDRR